jgi:hypothetical protein
MSKHQNGNKEAKKPKQVRAVAPPVSSTDALPVIAPLNRAKQPGKR